jgi:hypothetical protein
MRKTTFVFTCIIFSLGLVFGQDSKPYVTFFSSGDVQLFSDGTSSEIEMGTEIGPNDYVKLEKESKVVLVTELGQNIVIEDKGKYDYGDMTRILQTGEGNITNAYFSYVWKKFNYQKEKDPDKMPMSVIGGVRRAEDTWMLWPLNGSSIDGATIVFEWEESAPEYFFQIIDEEDNVVLKILTKETSLELFPFESGFEDGKSYSWLVSPTSSIGNLDKYSFMIPDKAWWDTYKKEKEELETQLREQTSDAETIKAALVLFDESKGIVGKK